MLIRMTLILPHLNENKCLNNLGSTETCTRCQHICPTDAISLDTKGIPRLDTSACTSCIACVRVCPADAIEHEAVQPVELLQEAHNLVMQGRVGINAACNAVSDTHPGLKVPCHAIWDPVLLACMAAEGVRTLHLEGIGQCDSCSVRHGAEIMRQTEKDYATLNKALGVHMVVSRQAKAHTDASSFAPEPERRIFFRNLIPSLTQGAAIAVAQIGHAASRMARQETHKETASSSRLPIRLRLFLRALPRLQVNFTPIPHMLTLPLGTIQANANCTACNKCVERCPTKALDIREFGNNKVLEFRPDACVGCQHCIALCPEHALDPLPGISLPAVLARHARPLVMVSGDAIRQN